LLGRPEIAVSSISPHWVAALYPAAGFGIEDLPHPADFTGVPFLGLTFASPLTNAGGTIGLLTVSGEGFCANAGCSAGHYQRFVTAGSVVGTAVPEPPTLLLLAFGIGAAMLARQRGQEL